MLRYTMFILATAGFIGGIVASAIPDRAIADASASINETIIHKNQAFPVFGPIEVEDCATEDCAAEVDGVEV